MYMEEHPDYGISVLRNTYHQAFSYENNIDTCKQLRLDKWKTCHPHESNLPLCASTMSIDQLKTLYEQHRSCYHFRATENQSVCFDKVDHGHIKAEQVERTLAEQCRIFLYEKMGKPEPILDKPEPITSNPEPILDNPKPIQDKKVKTKRDPATKKTKREHTNPDPLMKPIIPTQYTKRLTVKWWVYILGIVAIVGIGVFLFYVY